ncbi:hypothetical protein [Nonomuraea angiospora]|uniref:hypothetical protein n=1 Tax=Nonomuraea angiospora TaxID=46172 RepID=UPI00299FA176|nr:hypothetical protein [Nonomuraea angiospora]MDX3100502.1 hypothetical protein [Nonomuraea angiospora]
MKGERMKVHWNLHEHAWTLTALSGPDKGHVVAYVDNITLSNVTFKVSEAGRRRSLRLGHRTVHAHVVGIVVSIDDQADVHGMTKITYNPAADRAPTFETSDGSPVHWAPLVLFARDPRKPEHGYGWITSGCNDTEGADG